MLNLFSGKNLRNVLSQTKTLKIRGVKFEIKRIHCIEYLEGQKVLKKSFDTYQKSFNEDTIVDDVNWKKTKEHMMDVILSGVVTPILARKKEGPGVFIEDLFNDWEMINLLYSNIIEYTYGKKK